MPWNDKLSILDTRTMSGFARISSFFGRIKHGVIPLLPKCLSIKIKQFLYAGPVGGRNASTFSMSWSER